MSQQDSLAERFATPPRDVEWEELWGAQNPVETVRQLFPFAIAATVLAIVFLLLGWPYFASFTLANLFLILRLRTLLFKKARASLKRLEPRDYSGIFVLVVPVMLAIWIFLGAFLKAIFAADAGV